MIVQRKNIPAAIVLVLAVLALVPADAAGSAPPAEPIDPGAIDSIVVLSRGRQKPFATQAREALVVLFGTADVDDGSCTSSYLRLLFEREAFLDLPLFEVENELSDTLLGGRRTLSARAVVEERDRLIEYVSRAQGLFDSHSRGDDVDGDELKRIEELRNQIMELFGRVNGLRDPLGELRFLPDPTSSSGQWLNLNEARALRTQGYDRLETGVAAFEAIEKSYLAGDQARFDEAVAALVEAQRGIADDSGTAATLLPSGMVRFENLYYAVDFKWTGLVLFAACSLLFLAQAFMGKSGIGRAATLVLLLGILWNCWIIGGHTAIAGRLPLKNLQEVYLVVLFFVPLIGLFLGAILKSRVYSALGAALTAVGFVGSICLEPQGYMIAPLVAILQSPWRQVHILTIMLSYAILLVAFGLHVAYLCVAFFPTVGRKSGDQSTRASDLAVDLDHKAYLLVAWGFLFLTVGISTGAAWGHSSWGRYWGWDPKEVWATVAWAIYALFLHLRIFFHVRREVLALINIVGYGAILFTYFGVTYLLPGLHAYS